MGGGAELFAGALAGLSEFADSKHAGNIAAQAQFYVDPRPGQRIAVVDAFSISYNGKEPRVHAGRLTFDDKDRPVLNPRPRTLESPVSTAASRRWVRPR